jgi:hypothetical protein
MSSATAPATVRASVSTAEIRLAAAMITAAARGCDHRKPSGRVVAAASRIVTAAGTAAPGTGPPGMG